MNTDKNKIWEEIINSAKNEIKLKKENEMSLKDFCNVTGMNVDAARKYLNRMIYEGKMTKRMTPNPAGTGGSICLYEPIS